MLAERAVALLAVDVSPEALGRARRNCVAHPNVRFERRTMPHDFPSGCFDLITVCEFGFYLDRADLMTLREHVIAHSAPGAHIVLVHWTPRVQGHATTAEEVHEAFREAPTLRHLHGFSEQTYRLDLLERLADA